MLRLNYDSINKNGIIFNERYPLGALYNGEHLKPQLTFDFDDFLYQENSDSFFILNGSKIYMSDEQISECRNITVNWIQELGQEGNPNQEQMQQVENDKNRKFLLDTDWYIIRQVETGQTVPDEVLLARNEAREAVV